MVERTYMQKGRIRAPQKLLKLLILCYVIVSKHPQCAAGTVQNSSTRIRSEGEWQPGPRQPSAAPWLPDPPAPLPRAGEKQNAASGSAPQWLAPCQTSRTSRAHGRKWPEPSAQVTEQRPELCAVLCRGGGARAHTRAHSSPRLRPRGLRSGPDDSRLESGRPQHLPEDSILEGLPGKPTFNLEVVWVSQNFWSVLGTLQTHRSFYKVRHLALKRDVSSIFQHCGGLLSYMSVSEGEKHLSGRTPRVHPERSTLVVKPELNLLIV